MTAASALDPYAETIFKRTYARWSKEHKRREHFPEAVDRYLTFFERYLRDNYGYTIFKGDLERARQGMEHLQIMPSMRALMTAGVAMDHVAMANYNCTAHGIDSIEAISELMYILMCGSGSGFSVEKRFTRQLPTVPRHIEKIATTIVVSDNRIGWCKALHQFLSCLYRGQQPRWDISKLRKKGARLETFGGYSSGGEVLSELFHHIVKIFREAAGNKLTPYQLFSICCYIAQIVVVGGVRRSATICLFDLDDLAMLSAKTGEWWKDNPHFAMANISAVFEERPNEDTVREYWNILQHSGSGEPGIFNRGGIWKHLENHGRSITYSDGALIPFLANPCCEIVLRPQQACNLSGVAIRPGDDLNTLLEKQDIATMLGTWQACVNHFEYVRDGWKENIDEERLLGVCLSGFYDHYVLSQVNGESQKWLRHLRDKAIRTNQVHADMIGIPHSASVTSVKPAGNSGELYGTASGIHPRYSRFYRRNIRVSDSDPVTAFLQASGIPNSVSVQNERDVVFSFPRKSPYSATLASDITALEQLEHWKHVKKNYTTHTASATIYIRDHEWEDAGRWVYENFDEITGLAFLPFDGGTYEQAPIERIDERTYNEMVREMPELNWDLMKMFEQNDTTSPSQELVCVGDKCTL